jgi:endoglucanase
MGNGLSNPRPSLVTMDSRARYTAFVARTAEKFKFCWAYWQFDSDFIVYNIEKDAWVIPILDALMRIKE